MSRVSAAAACRAAAAAAVEEKKPRMTRTSGRPNHYFAGWSAWLGLAWAVVISSPRPVTRRRFNLLPKHELLIGKKLISIREIRFVGFATLPSPSRAAWLVAEGADPTGPCMLIVNAVD